VRDSAVKVVGRGSSAAGALPSAALLLVLGVIFAGPALAQSGSVSTSADNAPGAAPTVAEVPASAPLLRVRTLIKANVLDLAQRVMEQQGPPQLPNGEWLNWERQLWALYAAQEKWQLLIDRVQAIPPAFPEQIKTEAEQRVVAAYIALGNGSNARTVLRKRLLSSDLTERHKRELRRQVIETYMADGLLPEASAAAATFQADYRAQDNDWLLLNAGIALASGDPDRAVNLLAPLDAASARVLRLYARVRNGSLEPLSAIEHGETLLSNEAFTEWQYPLLAVMVDAARRAADVAAEIDLLERYLLVEPRQFDPRLSFIPSFSATDLNDAYREYAYGVANEAGYLRGEEDGWGRLATQLDPARGTARRALWATISTTANSNDNRVEATNRFVDAVIDIGRIRLVSQLFGDIGVMGPLKLSPATGLRLSNIAIEAGDMQLAADANATISGPPPGMDDGEWLRQSGRVAIIAGRHEQGAAQLERWIQSRETFTAEETDSVLQPIFDLQTVDQHRLAISLLEQVETRAPGGRYPREIAFWLAESYSATGQHVKAADYFLFSALQKDNGFDQWGESARYRAADALLEGNFFKDARTLFEDLLKRATEDTRRQALEQKLQDLRLRQSSLEGEEKATS